MKSGQNRIQIRTRQVDGFTATINDPVLKKEVATLGEPVNHCLNCPTEIEPQENFCAHCFSQLPDDLLGAWFNCKTQNARLYALQGMLDFLAQPGGRHASDHDPATCQHCQSIEHLKPAEPIPLALLENLIREISEEITDQQKMLADITAIRDQQYPAEAR
jgi:hypothetical protein